MRSVIPASPAAEAHVRPLDAVLRPTSVAIIGASADPTKRGHQIIRALRASGFAGAIYAVNPRGGELLDLPVYRTIADVPEPPDLAVLCTPAASAPDVIDECARVGVRAALVLALGFRESGPAGEALEARMRTVSAQSGIRVIGPNTSGLLDVRTGLNLIGLCDVPRGTLALVVQSGNVLLEQVTHAQVDGGEGYAVCLGLGNMADVAWHDALEHLAADDGVRALLMYAEGFERGRAFVDAAARAARRKPLALLKGGRTDAGLHAARSHTGAVASGHAVVRAALRAAGVTEVRRTDELRAIGTVLAWQPAVRRGDVAILSDGGGHATLAADTLSALGVGLAELSDDTRRSLRELLGPAAAVANPVDVAGATDRATAAFTAALRVLLADDAVGAVLLVGLFGGYAIRFAAELAPEETQAASDMAAAARASGRAFLVHSLYHAAHSEALDRLRAAEVPVIGSLETACAAVAALVERGRMIERPMQQPLPEPARGAADIITAARAEGRTALIEPEARALAERYGAALVPATFCTRGWDATTAAAALGRNEVAIRLVSASILHKSEAGGVRLRVEPRDAAAAFDALRRDVSLWAAERGIDADVRGVLVSPMLPPPAVELIIGVRRDASFGPLLALGIGGVAVEALGDVVVRMLPTTRAEIRSALGELRAAELLRGLRGGAAPDLDEVADLALALGQCLLDNPDISDIEANPVFAYADRAVAVDVRALLSDA